MSKTKRLLFGLLCIFSAATIGRIGRKFFACREMAELYEKYGMTWQEVWRASIRMDILFFAVVAVIVLLILFAIRMNSKHKTMGKEERI